MGTLGMHCSRLWRSIFCNYLMIPLFAIFFISLRKTQAQGQFSSQLPGLASSSTEKYTIGDQFGSNLDNVLINLVYDTPSTGMNVFSYGDFPNSVYGLLQCRGDASQKECHDCCQTVMPNVSAICANGIECRLWLPICELHYRNGSFISDYWIDTESLDPQMDVQGMAFRDLVSNLSVIASTSTERFAEGASVDSSGHPIYALLQCYRDISTADCSNCFANATTALEKNYSAIYLASCYVLLSTTPSAIPPNSSPNRSVPTNRSEKLPCMNLRLGRDVLLLIALLLLSM